MANTLHDFLARDHERLDALLAQCLGTAGNLPYDAYDAFRRGLLRHIGIEERLLFPVLRTVYGVTIIERLLHRDHAALAALLVPPPTLLEMKQIVGLLEAHNDFEERTGGLYEVVESVAGNRLPDLLQRVHATAPVRVAAHADSPVVRANIAQLLRDAHAGRAHLRDSELFAVDPTPLR